MDRLISTDMLALCEPHQYRVVETGMTPGAYDAGHLPGAVYWPYEALMTPENRLRDDPAHFQGLLSRAGIAPETWVICSFDGSPAMAGWAAWLFWILTGWGHTNTLVLDGGTPLWRAQGRPLTPQKTAPTPTHYPALPPFRESHRATRDRVRDASACLLDARSEKEFGERIPSAKHLPHTAFFQADGTYRPVQELNALLTEAGAGKGREIITYCAVGIRAAVPWFVLKHLLGYSEVRNYDGSWNEWSQGEEASI